MPRLRPRDRAALEALGDPVRVVEAGLANSVAAWAVDLDGEIAVLYGVRVVNLLDDRAYVWMLGTDAVDKHPVAFLRHSRIALERLRGRYSLLYGEIESDFEASVRWLTWCGARIQNLPSACVEGQPGSGRSAAPTALIFSIEGIEWRRVG